MNKKSVLSTVVVIVIGVALIAWMMRQEANAPATEEAHGKEPGALDYPRGPHGQRLLSSADLQLEVTIFETGVEPQFRVYPYDSVKKPIPPREVQLTIELHRLGGRIDQIAFVPESDYLRGEAVVEEPHSFDVKVKAQRNGRTQEWAYSQIEGKVQLGDDAVKSTGIQIQTAGPRQMITTMEVPGEIKSDPARVARIVPRLGGIVTEVRKQIGDRVRRGEIVAIISSRELADAKSAYLAAVQHAKFSQVKFEREEGLWKKKISAEQDYLEAKLLLDEARLAQTVAAQKLIVLGTPAASLQSLANAPVEELPRYEVRASLDGVVMERSVNVGAAVPAEKDLFVTADLSSVWVEASITAKDLNAVYQGQSVTVRSTDLGREVNGRVTYIGPLVGEETRTAPTRIVIANPDGKWRPGLFVSVRLVTHSANIPIAVPTEALQTFRDWQVVFVRFGDEFEARPLELGRSDGQWIEVREGLKAGEKYAATNSFAIKAEIGKLGATHDH